MSSNYTWDDSWFDFMFAHADPPEDAWQKLLNAPESGMPRFPLDSPVTVGCKMLNGSVTRYELTLTDDGAHEVHRCPVHLDNITDELYILGIIGRFQ